MLFSRASLRINYAIVERPRTHWLDPVHTRPRRFEPIRRSVFARASPRPRRHATKKPVCSVRLSHRDHLLRCTSRFANRRPPILIAFQFRMRERKASQRLSQYIARRRLAILGKIEAWPRVDVGVTPTVEYDPGNVPTRIEARTAEHFYHLKANLTFIFPVCRAQHSSAGNWPLLRQWEAQFVEWHIEGQQIGFIRIQRRSIVADVHV